MKKLVLSFLALVATTALFAQMTTSSISGSVSDQKGTALVGATVVAVHTPSGTQYGAVVDAKGYYRLHNLRPGGPYTITVSMLGYKTAQAQNVNLVLADNLTQNYTLGEETQGIQAIAVVTDGLSSNMRSDRAGAVTSIDAEGMALMPSTSRSLTSMIRLTPQANGSSIGGGNYRQSNISVDGSPFNNSFGIGQNMPANGSPISIDALDQISVNVTPYDVRQTGFLGASVNAVTRSGDNEFRGSAYTYMNNEKYKGNKVGDVTFDRSPSEYKLYGFRFGGPIIKNKLFFFVNYEEEKTTQPGPARVAQNGADRVYTDGKNNVARPTETEMNNIRQYLVDNYGYNPGAYQGYSFESPSTKFLARIDWNITKNHKLNVRYSKTEAKEPSSSPSGSTTGLAKNPMSGKRNDMSAITFQNAAYYSETNYESFAAELNSVFADKFHNTLRVSYSHQNEPRSTDGGEFPFVDILKDGRNFTSFGTELFSYGNLRDVKTWTVTDELTWSSGIHNFTAGLAYETNETKNGFQRFGTGYYAFNSWEDFVNGNKASVFAITHSNASDFSQQFPTFEFKQASAYFQDEMNVNPYFKLTAGLRVDLPFYPDINHSYNKAIHETAINGVHYNTAELPKNALLFSPRVGFNWDILKDRSLVLRGGSGLFTGRIPFVWIVAQSGDAGVLQTTYTTADQSLVPDFHANRMDILHNLYPTGAPAAGSVLPQSLSMMDPDLKLPQTWKTSLALDAKLPWGIKGSVEFIVNKDVHSTVITNKGIEPASPWNNGTADNRLVHTYGKYYNKTLKNVYILENGPAGGYYWSGTIKLEKDFDFGLSAMVAYTRSQAKNYSDGTGDQLGSAWQNNIVVNGANNKELGYAGYVIPNKLVASLNYRTKTYAKCMSTEIGLVYQGGEQGRYSYIYNGGINNDNGYSSLVYVPRPGEITFEDYTPSGWDHVYTAAQQEIDFFNYVDHDKYLKTRKGTYAERNACVYPWVHQFDLKIAQNFFVDVKGKRNTIQVALDILNVGNLINKNWGHEYNEFSYNTAYLLKQSGYTTHGVAPKYRFEVDGMKAKTSADSKYIGYSSTYAMQLSFRYIFN